MSAQGRSRRKALVALGLLAVAAALAVAVAAAAATSAPRSAKLLAIGGTSFKVNKYVQDGVRWAPGTLTIRSGGTLTIVNKTSEPHTFSIVKKSQLPRTKSQMENCKICLTIAQAHGVDPNSNQQGPPPKPLVDVGKVGFDEPGDSDARIAPKGSGPSVQDKITAKAGTTLYYLCLIHPWMQGKIVVK